MFNEWNIKYGDGGCGGGGGGGGGGGIWIRKRVELKLN